VATTTTQSTTGYCGHQENVLYFLGKDELRRIASRIELLLRHAKAAVGRGARLQQLQQRELHDWYLLQALGMPYCTVPENRSLEFKVTLDSFHSFMSCLPGLQASGVQHHLQPFVQHRVKAPQS
jgi:hypothetical protein